MDIGVDGFMFGDILVQRHGQKIIHRRGPSTISRSYGAGAGYAEPDLFFPCVEPHSKSGIKVRKAKLGPSRHAGRFKEMSTNSEQEN